MTGKRASWPVPALTLWLLLPMLFQTGLRFYSSLRLGWELAYLVLTVLAVWAVGKTEGRAGRLALPGACAALGALCVRNPFLAAALLAVAWVLWRWVRPGWARRACAGALVCLTMLAGLRLSVDGLSALLLEGGRPVYRVPVPGEDPRRVAEVTVTDPGAMGRVRYHAVEQYELVCLGDGARISWVTGRDSAPSGDGRYGYLVEEYFASWDGEGSES